MAENLGWYYQELCRCTLRQAVRNFSACKRCVQSIKISFYLYSKFRDFSQADYCSIIMDYDYDANAKCPVWESFIDDVTDEEPRRAENLQFIAGYTLFSDCRHQKVFILVGSGGNGKSVYLEIVLDPTGSPVSK